MSIYESEIKSRIETHIISKEDCWITDYGINQNGRQYITVNKKTLGLLRVVYDLYKGEVAKDLFVCHSCNNNLCINPDHLFLGNKVENGRNQKRRNKYVKGSQVITAKLTEQQVASIKDLLGESKLTFAEIAKMFSVKPETISCISQGRTWRHVDKF